MKLTISTRYEARKMISRIGDKLLLLERAAEEQKRECEKLPSDGMLDYFLVAQRMEINYLHRLRMLLREMFKLKQSGVSLTLDDEELRRIM